MAHRRIHADHAWSGNGFANGVALDVEDGRIAGVGASSGAADLSARYVLPGMPNLHSHAFQRAMAGLAERQSHSDDSFWTWREVMYAFAGRIGPDDLRAIAAQRPDGQVFVRADKSVPYGEVVAVMAAIKQSGIRRVGMVTALPPGDG